MKLLDTKHLQLWASIWRPSTARPRLSLKMYVRAFGYSLELSNGSLHSWSHIKLHKYDYYQHLVVGPISALWGQPHLEPVHVCSECKEEISGISTGDEGWNYCESCQALEPNTLEWTTEQYEAHHG